MATINTSKVSLLKRHQEMSEDDKYANQKIIQSMNKRVNYLKNPRFKESKRPLLYSDVSLRQNVIEPVNSGKTLFRAFPQQIIFRDYLVNQIYELDLCLTNVSNVLKRIKYIPPSQPEFAIGAITYPSQTDGNVAPGMSVYMKIRFNPSSIAEFDDEIAIITEENIFKIALLARKDPPRLDLPETLDCKSCWLGDQIDVKFKVTNVGGEAGYKFSKITDEDQTYDDHLQVGNFIVSPANFFLQKNQSQEIQVYFKPDHEGETVESLVLRCDDHTSQTIKVLGKGNMVELSIASLDGKPLNQIDQSTTLDIINEPFQKIFFYNAIPNQISSRTLQIKNITSVQVKYHWTLFKKDQEMELPSYFQISPSEGHFLPDEVIEFTISLQSSLYIPLFGYANLIIDEIPMEAIRNPPDSLKSQFSQEVGNLRPSITYFEFDLISFQSLCDVHIEPPFYVFPTSLSVSEIYKKNFVIANTSLCQLNFEVSIDMQSSDSIMTHIGQRIGVLEPNQKFTLELGIGSEIIGKHQKIVYKIDFDYSNSMTIEIISDFQAPQISVLEPMVNFGLIKTNTLKSFTITLQNQTSVKAQVDISCESGGPKLQFIPENLEIQPLSQQKVEILFQAFDSETYKDFLIVQVRGGIDIVLEIFAEVQSPNVSLNRVLLAMDCIYSSNTYTFDERSQYNIVIQNLGNIPTPFAWELPIDQSKFMVQFEPMSGVVPPKTNLPIKFSIKPNQGGNLEQIFICDVDGLEFPLGFELITKVLGLSVEYEQLDEDNLEMGNGSSTHRSQGRSQGGSQQSKRKSFFKQSFASKTGNSLRSQKTKRVDMDLEDEDDQIVPQAIQMEKIEFYNCTISKPKQMKFMIKNTSGIHTQYRFFMETYEANEDDLLSNEDLDGTRSAQTKSIRFAVNSDGQSRIDGKSTNSRSIIKKGKVTQEGRPTTLLTDRIEKTQNFTSVDGQKLIHLKKLENDQRLYLSNNLGLAVVCEPKKGALAAYASVQVTVTCFNDICGLFQDNLCVEVRGLEVKKFPVTVDVKGSPVVITQNQLGISYGGEIPFFDIGAYMRNSGLISRELRVTNTGPKDVEIDWKCYNLGGQSGQSKYFDIKIIDPPLGSTKMCEIQFLATEPQEAVNGPFHISPKQQLDYRVRLVLVRGRREKHFTINFQTGDTGIFNAVIVAKPRLIQANESDQPVGSISLYMRAETIHPTLYLDKLPRDGNTHKIKFQQWTNGFNKRQEKRLCLVNKQKSGFVCSVELEGPFKFLSTSSSSPQKYELQSAQTLRDGPQKTFNLVQNSHVELIIKFDGPQSTNFQEWPMNYKVYKEGELNIFFANGDHQKILLEGILLRPYIHLNTSGIQNVEGPQTLEFGVVHISNKKTLQFHLSNLSSVPASWKLNYIKYPMKKNLVEQTMTLLDKEDQAKTDDQSVFEFQVAEGTIQGPSTMVHTLPHASALPHQITLKEIYDLGIEPHKILVNFRPKKNILYKSKYRITVQDGPAVEFILKGTGTYDENLEKTYD